MKKLLFVTTLFVVTFANAQKSVIKADPIGLIFGVANASYERVISENRSITFSGSYYNYPDSGDRIELKGYGFGANYNFYFSNEKDAPKGFHAGPGIGYSFLKYSKKLLVNESGIEELKLPTFNLNANIGHQWLISDHFAIDLVGQYYFLTNADIIGTKRSNFSVGISLGYAW